MFSNVFTPLVISPFFCLILFIISIEVFSIIGLPFIALIFKNWKDRGYIFSRLIGLIISTYIIWLGASLKLVPFNQFYLCLVVILLLIISIGFFNKNKNQIKSIFSDIKSTIFLEEVLFWLFFFLLLAIRFGNPDLWHPYMGGEKPMDFAIINSLVRGQSIPPLDPWFAGSTLNYYYYGHYLLASLIKLINISPSIAYNLILPFLFAQSAMGIFSIVNNLTHPHRKISFIGSVFTVISGNLAQLPFIIKSFTVPPSINSWYWNATRIMPNNEINEFPFFSFLYADLHSHVIALSISILVIANTLTFTIENIKVLSKRFWSSVLLISLIMGILRAANTWDYPSYMMFLGLFLFISVISSKKRYFLNFIKVIFIFGIITLISTVLIIPFLNNFQTGKLIVSLYHGAKTTFKNYVIINGLFLFLFASFAFALTKLRKTIFKDKPITIKIFLLYLVAIILTIIPDIIDIPLGLGRMNTVFKFYFQAWIFFAIASASSLSIIMFYLRRHSVLKIIWSLFFIILFSITLSYPLTATPAKIKDRMNSITPHTLDGMLYMKDSQYFDNNHSLNLFWDYEAINWMNSHIVGSPVIAEAVTPDYRWGSRISDYTGLPTLLGWEYHELVYRSSMTGSEFSSRAEDVKTLYNTPSLNELKYLINKYNIEYICVGELEKAYYEPAGLDKFTNLIGDSLDIAYQNGGMVIYKVRKPIL